MIYVLAAAALLEAWGIAAFTWLADLAQQPSARSVISLAIVLLGGLVLWEFFSATIERKLAGIDHAGRSRARTVLPLLRSTVLVVLIIIAGLMVLSQIGINIAPLLAGAGIAGIAIGFGAQALVKDVITGFFMLLEDTFAVGDRVDVGGGHVGVIEAVSIRNFRLRDIQGIVHTVPFSAITTVLNMSRDFAYVVCDAGIVYREDPDRVIEVMREAGKELAAEPRWSRYVLAPLEILGVERFTDTAMIIRARIKTAPPFQLELAREFNRVLKKAFDRAGIEMASVNQLNYAKQLAVATGTTQPRRRDQAGGGTAADLIFIFRAARQPLQRLDILRTQHTPREIEAEAGTRHAGEILFAEIGALVRRAVRPEAPAARERAGSGEFAHAAFLVEPGDGLRHEFVIDAFLPELACDRVARGAAPRER